jgi:hypothetical protein
VRIELADVPNEADLVTAFEHSIIRKMRLPLGAGDILRREVDVDAGESFRGHHFSLSASQDSCETDRNAAFAELRQTHRSASAGGTVLHLSLALVELREIFSQIAIPMQRVPRKVEV